MIINPGKILLWGGLSLALFAVIYLSFIRPNYQSADPPTPRQALAQATSIIVVSPRPSWIEQKFADAIPPSAKLEFLTPVPSSTPTPAFALVKVGDDGPTTIILAPEKPDESGTLLTRPEMAEHYVALVEKMRSSQARPTSKKSAPSTIPASEERRGGPPGFGLKVGMTFDEVRAVRGKPSGQTTDGTLTHWSYDRVPLKVKIAKSAESTVSYKTSSAIGIPIVGDVLGSSAGDSIRESVSHHVLGLDFINGRLVRWTATTLH
jgi:hypothetical protein